MKTVILIFILTIFTSQVVVLASEDEAVSAVGTLSSITTALNDNIILPVGYILEQNHPNPFNPSTTISYAIPKSSYVIIKIFDVNGREIKALVNKKQNVGFYNVVFDAASLASGLYFYTLISENFTSTKKMILVK